MNARRWLILSVALNALLAALVVWAMLGPHGGKAAPSAARQLTNRTLRVRKVVKESEPATLEVPAPFHWSEVESTDYRVYMANLRAIECPARTIREIIVADVDGIYCERLRQLLAPLHREFWRYVSDLDVAKAEGESYEKAWEALKDERAAVFKELLGRENPHEIAGAETQATNARAQLAQLLDFLSAEKSGRVVNIRESCKAAVRKLWESDHQLTKEEFAERQRQQRALEADRDRQLTELLTPEELAEYRLRDSPGMNSLLRQSRVEFSEDEIRAIARTAAARFEAEAQARQSPAKANKQREEIARQADAELKAALGEARFADYLRANDNRFEHVSAVIERYELPAEKALEIYDMQRQAETQAQQLRADGSRTVEERTTLLQAIRDETERSVSAAFGSAAFATYRARGGDGWLQGLATPPK